METRLCCIIKMHVCYVTLEKGVFACHRLRLWLTALLKRVMKYWKRGSGSLTLPQNAGDQNCGLLGKPLPIQHRHLNTHSWVLWNRELSLQWRTRFRTSDPHTLDTPTWVRFFPSLIPFLKWKESWHLYETGVIDFHIRSCTYTFIFKSVFAFLVRSHCLAQVNQSMSVSPSPAPWCVCVCETYAHPAWGGQERLSGDILCHCLPYSLEDLQLAF